MDMTADKSYYPAAKGSTVSWVGTDRKGHCTDRAPFYNQVTTEGFCTLQVPSPSSALRSSHLGSQSKKSLSFKTFISLLLSLANSFDYLLT